MSRPDLPQPTPANWLMVAALGIIWGATFMVVAIALRGYGPLTVATARTTLGALALIGLTLALGRKWPGPDLRLWAHLIPVGLLSSALPFFLLSWGQQFVPSAFAGLSMAALPLFVLPLAHFFAGEPLSRRKALGFGIGFLGTLVLLGVEVFAGDGAALPRLACLGAVLSYAAASILTRRCPPVDPMALSASGLMIGTLALVPAMLLTEGVPGWAGPVPGLAILFLGLVPTAFAALLRVLVIRSAGSGFMTLTNYQVPVWSMAFGALVLGEALPGRFYLALGLILVGLAISQWSSLKQLLSR